jgi:hypothetical protein
VTRAHTVDTDPKLPHRAIAAGESSGAASLARAVRVSQELSVWVVTAGPIGGSTTASSTMRHSAATSGAASHPPTGSSQPSYEPTSHGAPFGGICP